jgi:hypothetical protein
VCDAQTPFAMQARQAASPAPSQQAISAEVQAVVTTLVGRAIDPEQPLMEAGLDSLGEWTHAVCDAGGT